MKIGLDAQRIFRLKKHGMETVALEVIRALQKLDSINEYIIFVRDDVDNTCITETENFKILKVPAFSYPDWEQFFMPRAVKKEKIDFLHCMSTTAPLFSPAKTLITLHDIIFLESYSMDSSWYQSFGNLYRRSIVPKVVKNASQIITLSHFEKQNILNRLHLPDEKIKVIYNAVSNRFHNNYTHEEYRLIKEKYQLPDNFILFSANDDPRKNTKGVIKAFAKYCEEVKDGLPLVILNYDKKNTIHFLKESQQESYIKNFIFPPYVTYSDLPLVYGLADLFLYPSFREGFGLPILEAMACKIPVITSNTSSMPEIAGEGAILINPEKPDEITEAICQILQNRDFRNHKIEKGFTQSQKFNWDHTAREMLNIYKSLS